MIRRKAWLLSVIGAVLLLGLAAFALTTEWGGRFLWSEGPEYPVSAVERKYLSAWRDFDLSSAPPMFSMPFGVKCDLLEPAADAILIDNLSKRPIRNVWFYREDMPNFYSTATIVESVTADKETETDKVLALWELFPEYYYNYYPVSEGGLLFDPPTLFAVIGSAQCNYAASVLETLCQMIGCETRTLGIEYDQTAPQVAHCTMEVRADGRWIFMDPDGHAVYRRADGALASAADLMSDPSPIETGGHAYFNPCALANAFTKGTLTFFEHGADTPALSSRHQDPGRFLSRHHYMRYDLLPGVKITLRPNAKGRYFQLKLPDYAGGTMKWSCLPSSFGPEADSGLLLDNAVAAAEGSSVVFRRAQVGQSASVVIPMVSPYLVVGARVVGHVEAMETPSVYVLPFDRGKVAAHEGWIPLKLNGVKVDLNLDSYFGSVAHFGYALKIEVPITGVRLGNFEVLTYLQCAPKALPYLTPGDNRFIRYSGETNIARPYEDKRDRKPGVRFDDGLRISFSMPQSDAEHARLK
jgi:hypothetical protein